MNAQYQGATALSHWGVIRAQGVDAVKFLHGQLTQDFALLPVGQARLAAYCNAKGRMLASFIGIKTQADEVLLLCPREILPVALKQLTMFVLRAKLKLSDASSEFALWGLLGAEAQAEVGASATPWHCTLHEPTYAVALYPAQGQARALLLAPALHAAPSAAALSLDLWNWAEVQSGVVAVNAAIAQALVPQMLNYESVGGVNFKKGCYPGQEVVARSQFRGTLKRRAFIVHSAQTMNPGDELFHNSDSEQACGVVVQAAPAPTGGYDAVCSLQLSATLSGSLHHGSANGPALTLLALPYDLLADV